jgi:hypothetical protein
MLPEQWRGHSVRVLHRLKACATHQAKCLSYVRTMRRNMSNDAATQRFVFAGEQLLGEIVAALIGVAARAGKMMIDP